MDDSRRKPIGLRLSELELLHKDRYLDHLQARKIDVNWVEGRLRELQSIREEGGTLPDNFPWRSKPSIGVEKLYDRAADMDAIARQRQYLLHKMQHGVYSQDTHTLGSMTNSQALMSQSTSASSRPDTYTWQTSDPFLSTASKTPPPSDKENIRSSENRKREETTPQSSRASRRSSESLELGEEIDGSKAFALFGAESARRRFATLQWKARQERERMLEKEDLEWSNFLTQQTNHSDHWKTEWRRELENLTNDLKRRSFENSEAQAADRQKALQDKRNREQLWERMERIKMEEYELEQDRLRAEERINLDLKLQLQKQRENEARERMAAMLEVESHKKAQAKANQEADEEEFMRFKWKERENRQRQEAAKESELEELAKLQDERQRRLRLIESQLGLPQGPQNSIEEIKKRLSQIEAATEEERQNVQEKKHILERQKALSLKVNQAERDLMEKQTRFEQEQEDIREAAQRLPRNAPARLLPGLSRVANMQVETRQEENYPLDKTTSAEKTETLTKQEFRNGDNWKGQMLPPPPRSPKTFHVANGSASTESSMKAKLSQPTVSDTSVSRSKENERNTLQQKERDAAEVAARTAAKEAIAAEGNRIRQAAAEARLRAEREIEAEIKQRQLEVLRVQEERSQREEARRMERQREETERLLSLQKQQLETSWQRESATDRSNVGEKSSSSLNDKTPGHAASNLSQPIPQVGIPIAKNSKVNEITSASETSSSPKQNTSMASLSSQESRPKSPEERAIEIKKRFEEKQKQEEIEEKLKREQEEKERKELEEKEEQEKAKAELAKMTQNQLWARQLREEREKEERDKQSAQEAEERKLREEQELFRKQEEAKERLERETEEKEHRRIQELERKRLAEEEAEERKKQEVLERTKKEKEIQEQIEREKRQQQEQEEKTKPKKTAAIGKKTVSNFIAVKAEDSFSDSSDDEGSGLFGGSGALGFLGRPKSAPKRTKTDTKPGDKQPPHLNKKKSQVMGDDDLLSMLGDLDDDDDEGSLNSPKTGLQQVKPGVTQNLRKDADSSVDFKKKSFASKDLKSPSVALSLTMTGSASMSDFDWDKMGAKDEDADTEAAEAAKLTASTGSLSSSMLKGKGRRRGKSGLLTGLSTSAVSHGPGFGLAGSLGGLMRKRNGPHRTGSRPPMLPP